MSELRFEWDRKKEQLNKRKHGISFVEAENVFADDFAILIEDPDHSDQEERFVLLGLSASLRILIVSHTYRKDDGLIRIISARKATPKEREAYNPRRQK